MVTRRAAAAIAGHGTARRAALRRRVGPRCAARRAARRRAATAGTARALPLLDRRNELALAHPAGAGHAERLREPLQFGQQHPAEPAATAAPAARRCLTGAARLAVPVLPGALGARWLGGTPGRSRRAPRRCRRREQRG